MNTDAAYQVRLIGYCSIEEEFLLTKFTEEGSSGLANLMGEYVIVIENDNECYIITSPYGACQYYYAVHRNELFHDDTVIGVLQKSGLPWSWNWRALADLIQLDFVLEDDTLHPQIHRVPAGSILHFRQGALTSSILTWEELNPPFSCDPETVLTALNDATRQWITDNVVVSMSGGFDSRVILSSLLKYDCRPLLLTMGFDNSTDVIISRQIASAIGLDSLVVTLRLEDYLRHGSRIVALTNGTKTACHWHTYLYPRMGKLNPGCAFFIGSNGEFARTYYVNKDVIALAANVASPLSLKYFWKRKLKRLFGKEEVGSLRKELAEEFTETSQRARLGRLISLSHNRLLSGLDRFYIEQRLRNFMGNGLKLYSEHVAWRAPFLSREWVSAIWNLNRKWKFGSNWHRFAIARNYPQLLKFPEEGSADRMRSKAPLLYWLPIRKRFPVTHYANYREWFRSDMILEFILENASLLSELIDENTVQSIVKEQRRDGRRLHAIAFLLTMIFWCMHLREPGGN